MIVWLLLCLGIAVGGITILVVAINVSFGMGWKTGRMEHVALLAGAAVGLTMLEVLRRWWLVPVVEWPWAMQAAAAACCLVAVVGLPLATWRRWSRTTPEGIERADTVLDLAGESGPSRFIGEGHHNWLLRIPGNESLGLVVHHWTARVPRLPAELDGLSILHMTDLHFHRAYDRRYFEAVFDAAVDEPADLVLVTGDLIDDPACIEWITPLFERLQGPFGRFAILGNHDHMHLTGPIAEAVEAAGFTVLDGTAERVSVMGKAVAIGGTCAPWGPPIPADALAGSPADFRLLMSHTPDLVYKAEKQGWDLVLSGHNHGGQVVLPGFGPVLMPSRYSRRFEQGFYGVGRSLLYVSRGIGGKHPIRIGCPPEIAHFTLKAADPNPRPAESSTTRPASRSLV
ncbi:putative metallophosphoesterase [Aquisphaera giovannonii]|uniref:Putative metallophosphoesterase n=1 Tax=Aquisphaera giovannonii TaxID=406548 RepID=A0A5B9WBU2_9BACT|nr:metallophosphoesterase [Aquisphaera giovannonii]QEH38076.1 putative metallophosphoesterase [Aquisphaera giovannonii]